MNTGIGDAINLAWKLAAVLSGGAEAKLLDTYETERIAFARKLVATTDRVFSFVTAEGRMADLLRTRLAPFLIPKMASFEAIPRIPVSHGVADHPELSRHAVEHRRRRARPWRRPPALGT